MGHWYRPHRRRRERRHHRHRHRLHARRLRRSRHRGCMERRKATSTAAPTLVTGRPARRRSRVASTSSATLTTPTFRALCRSRTRTRSTASVTALTPPARWRASVCSDGSTFAGPYNATTVSSNAGHWNVGPGVAPQANLYAYRVFGCAARATSSTSASTRRSQDDVNVISMSLGSPLGGTGRPDLGRGAERLQRRHRGRDLGRQRGHRTPTWSARRAPPTECCRSPRSTPACRPSRGAMTLSTEHGGQSPRSTPTASPCPAVRFPVNVLRNADGSSRSAATRPSTFRARAGRSWSRTRHVRARSACRLRRRSRRSRRGRDDQQRRADCRRSRARSPATRTPASPSTWSRSRSSGSRTLTSADSQRAEERGRRNGDPGRHHRPQHQLHAGRQLLLGRPAQPGLGAEA